MRALAALVLLTSTVALGQPTVPDELMEAAKVLTGTWKCRGEVEGAAVTGTNKVKVELDRWWLVETFELKAASQRLRVTTYTTYDPTARKWRRVGFDNAGNQMLGTAEAESASVPITFNLDLLGPGGSAHLRAHLDASEPKVGARMWGELSRDKGKSWTKAYDVTCKR